MINYDLCIIIKYMELLNVNYKTHITYMLHMLRSLKTEGKKDFRKIILHVQYI